MQTKPGCRCRCVYAWGLAGCLLLLLCWPALGLASRGQEMRRENPERWARVTVDRGQLSVDLSQADIQTVLAHIGGQAGVAVYIGRIEQRTVSTQFTGVDLKQGLQRLLRLASLNYMILYTRGPAGALVMKEVRVFGEDQVETAVTPLITQRDVKGVAAVDATETTAAQRFAAALAQAASPPAAPAEENEAARRFREALEQAQQRDTGAVLPKDLPQGEQETSAGARSKAGPAK